MAQPAKRQEDPGHSLDQVQNLVQQDGPGLEKEQFVQDLTLHVPVPVS